MVKVWNSTAKTMRDINAFAGDIFSNGLVFGTRDCKHYLDEGTFYLVATRDVLVMTKRKDV